MTDHHPVDVGKLLEEQLATASPDVLRGLLSTFIQALMGAEADALCGAGDGERAPQQRSNRRNGYRHRDFDTRAGTIDVAIRKLRSGSYFPDWLLQRRKRAERTLTSVGGHLLPAGRVDTADGAIGRIPRLDKPFQIAIVGDGGRARRTSGGIPYPPIGCRPVHVRGRRRLGAPRTAGWWACTR
jgi:Transposase, Mutator family